MKKYRNRDTGSGIQELDDYEILLLIFNTSFTKIMSSEIERSIEFGCLIFCNSLRKEINISVVFSVATLPSAISFDCRIQSNSVHRLSSIEFY